MPPIDAVRAPVRPPPKPAPLTLGQLNQNVGQWFAQHPAAAPAAKPAPAPPASSPTAGLLHGAGAIVTPRPAAVSQPASAYLPPPRVVPDARPHGAGTLTKTTSVPLPASVQYAYRQTPQYKQAILNVFLHQAAPERTAIVTGALKNPNTTESKIVLDYVRTAGGGLGSPVPNTLYAQAIKQQPGQDLLSSAVGAVKTGIGALEDPTNWGLPPASPVQAGLQFNAGKAAKAAGAGVGAAVSGVNKAMALGQSLGPTVGPGGGARVGAAATVLPVGVGKLAYEVPAGVAQAALQKPSVIPKTLGGLAEQTAGMVAGGAELPVRIWQQGPVKAFDQLAQQTVADVKRRYGPLVAGNYNAFVNRIKTEGAAPELFDAFTYWGGLDASLGRVATTLARTREAARLGLEGSDAARFVTSGEGGTGFLSRQRPQLLTSGSHVRPQELANTAGRITAQRLEDYIRSKKGGELVPQAGQVAPIFQHKAIRIVHSGIAQQYRRLMGETLNREVRGYSSSAQRAIGRLSNIQQKAIYYAVHGYRMDTAAHLREDLAAREQAILKDRANPASLGNRIPAQYADKVDELNLIRQLMPNAEKIAGPRMVEFQQGEAARAQRIEAGSTLHPATAEARRLRGSPAAIGIEHPDEMARRMYGVPESSWEQRIDLGREGFDVQAKRGLAEYEANRPQYLAKYNAKVREAMKAKDHPEPGYWLHQERPGVKYGDFTAGSGARAMPSDKRSTWALHKAGIGDTSPDAYLQGLARSIKRPIQWRLADAQFRAAALATPTDQEIEAALGRRVTAKPSAQQIPSVPRRTNLASELTGNELRRVLEHRGVDMNNVMFYNPGRLAEKTLADHGLLPSGKAIAETHDLADADIHHNLQQSDTVQPGTSSDANFLSTPGWKAIPKTAYDEIHGNLKANNLPGRVVGKAQGATAKLILGQNPHFVIINTLAHAIPAVAGTKGRILADLGRFPLWWHGLSDAERDLVRGYAGGRGGHFASTARLGSQAPNRFAAWGRQLATRRIVQIAQSVNPLHALLKAEDLQSNFFRHAVMYHEMKRMAVQDMAHEYGHAVAQWDAVKNVFSIKDPQERMRAIMQNQTKMEQLGRTTVNILGDYGRMTNRERTWFNNRAVLFYSFLRHVTRTLLYVLPIRHPLALGMMGELGNLHKQEVQKLLGGQNLPWAYGRLFFGGKNGQKLSSVDLTSTSPISSPLVDMLSGGIKEVPGLLSPMLGSVLDTAYGKTPLGEPVQRNAFSLVNELLSLSYPYRVAAGAELGLGPQQSDSIPWLHERAKSFKTPESKAYEAAKTQARGPYSQYMLGTTLGLYPKPDTSQVIAANQILKAQQAAQAKVNAAKKAAKAKQPKSTISSIWGSGGAKAKTTPKSVYDFQQALAAVQQGRPAATLPAPKPATKGIKGMWGGGTASKSGIHGIWGG